MNALLNEDKIYNDIRVRTVNFMSKRDISCLSEYIQSRRHYHNSNETWCWERLCSIQSFRKHLHGLARLRTPGAPKRHIGEPFANVYLWVAAVLARLGKVNDLDARGEPFLTLLLGQAARAGRSRISASSSMRSPTLPAADIIHFLIKASAMLANVPVCLARNKDALVTAMDRERLTEVHDKRKSE
jgi:hypothetical protein